MVSVVLCPSHYYHEIGELKQSCCGAKTKNLFPVGCGRPARGKSFASEVGVVVSLCPYREAGTTRGMLAVGVEIVCD